MNAPATMLMAIAVLTAGGLLTALAGKQPRLARGLFLLTSSCGLMLGAYAALGVLLQEPGGAEERWISPWAVPSERMQYTAASFASPLLLVFRRVLFPRVSKHEAHGAFPAPPAAHSETPDLAEHYGFRPLLTGLLRACRPVRLLQVGPVQLQILYVVVALASLLLWKMTL